MNILVVGGGGREHAIAATLSKSPLTTKLIVAPGNPGIETFAECYPIAADDIPRLPPSRTNKCFKCGDTSLRKNLEAT